MFEVRWTFAMRWSMHKSTILNTINGRKKIFIPLTATICVNSFPATESGNPHATGNNEQTIGTDLIYALTIMQLVQCTNMVTVLLRFNADWFWFFRSFSRSSFILHFFHDLLSCCSIPLMIFFDSMRFNCCCCWWCLCCRCRRHRCRCCCCFIWQSRCWNGWPWRRWKLHKIECCKQSNWYESTNHLESI